MVCTLNEDNLFSEQCGLVGWNRTLNFSVEDAILVLKEAQKSYRNLNPPVETVFIVIYLVLIAGGFFTNLMVCYVVARKSQMHTPRNLYIVNLSISDMTMCVICMPFTLIAILKREWTLGSALCKLVPVLEGTNIMISIGTITMIAMDRYFTIVRRHNSASTRSSVISCIISVWMFAVLASSPLAYCQVVEPLRFNNIVLYQTCIERWPSHRTKVFYNICILVIQALIPAAVVSTVHLRIASYLNTHAKSQTNQRRAINELKRNRRTTILLLGIVVLFLASWLPLNIFSLVVDVVYPPEKSKEISAEKLYFSLAVCHIIAMSSAVSNPIVYGFLNSNIRHEFVQLIPSRCATRNPNKNTEDQTTTRTMLATSTQRKSVPVTLQLKSEWSEKAPSPTGIQVESFML